MKVCRRCGAEKDDDEFGWVNAKLKDGKSYRYRRGTCRKCLNGQAATRMVRLRDRCRTIAYGHLAANPCVDCGEADPVVLEFDHVRGEKVADVAQFLRNRNVQGLADEIAKCDVVCANCHRRRTASRAGWAKLVPSGE